MSKQSQIDGDRKKPPLLIVISGPSGAGKDTVVQGLKKRDLPVHFVVTATTRPARANEKEGEDYFFVSIEEFTRMIDKEEMLEHANVYGDYKGIPKEHVREAMESGKDVLMRLDVQGAATIRKLYPEALLIFLTTADESELVERLKTRKSETVEEINLRIAMARQEYKSISGFDYLVANKKGWLETTLDTIEAIIVSEHHRVIHRKVSL